MQRWRKPPIFAFAYISPARSSKRRISSIFWRTVRQVSLSGRSCLTFPKPISSRPATSLGLWPPLPWSVLPSSLRWAPSPACVASLVAIGSESTHCRPRSILLTPDRGEGSRRVGGLCLKRSRTRAMVAVATRAPSHAASPTPTPAAIRTRRSSVRFGGAARRHTHCKLRRGQGGSGLLKAIISIEQPVPEGDGGNAANAALVGLLSGGSELVLHRLGLDRLEHRVWVELAGGRGDEDVVDVREILTAGEGLAECGEGEGDGAAYRRREGGGAHGLECVRRPVVGPTDRHEPVRGGAPLDLGHAGLALARDRPGLSAALLPDAAEKDRLPDRDHRKHLVNALGGEVGVWGTEVEIENRLLSHGVLITRQSDAAASPLTSAFGAHSAQLPAFVELCAFLQARQSARGCVSVHAQPLSQRVNCHL